MRYKRGNRLCLGALCLISKTADGSQLSGGLRTSSSTPLLCFIFMYMSTKDWQARIKRLVRFQTTRFHRKGYRTGRKWQFWVPNAQDIHNNSSSVKITHNGTISVKCLNDSLQITVLEKQFTISIRPKTEKRTSELYLRMLLAVFVQGGE